jgi:YYY domain-containing protein
MVESAISIPGLGKPSGPLPAGCAKWGGYFNSECSPLNPYNHNFGLFVYGTFPIFLTRLIGEVLGMTGYGEIHLLGRTLSALFDLATVLLIFFIGRRIYGVRVALLGALFLAASVLDIQQSHFFTVDTFTNVPILLAFWCALDIADGKGRRAFVGAGAAFGLALAGRINIAPFAVVLITAGVLRAWRAARDAHDSLGVPETFDRRPPTADDEEAPSSVVPPSSFVTFDDVLWGKLVRAFVGLAGAAIVALIVFRLFQPYAANGPNFFSPALPRLESSRGIVNVMFDFALSWAGGVNPKFADNMTYIGQLVAGQQDYPPGHQWTNRPAYIFPFENMVLWGLGLPLGLAAWAGFAFALYRLIRHREWRHLLVVVWIGITFAYTGQQWVKTMRYFLQIYPFLALLAGWFLIELWDCATADRRPQTADDSGGRRSVLVGRLVRVVVAVSALVVIGYTLFWAGAFTTIYTRSVSRVTASRWIFNHVPQGSILANEHWDDPLPLRIDGKDPFGGMYRSLASSPGDGEMHWYDEDTPEKRALAIQWIDEADYIILSSNRLYGSIPRLPMRYPLTTKYYDWLFDGTLGFEKVAEITSRPQLFGIEIDDDNAEEAFTVYDHPKVVIFEKSVRYSKAQITALFNSIDLSEVYRFWPREATLAPTALLLTSADRDAQARGGTWSQIFNPDDWINRVPVVVWLVLIEILGWLAFPIAFVAFRALADRGYVFAKALGVLLPAWGAWTLASYHLAPFSRASIALAIALIAAASALAVWWRGRDLRAFLRERWSIVLIEELLFFAFFGAFLLIRYGNPDLWHQWFGGEKPMEFAQLNAVIKSTWFPPYDPWFAGGYLDYYYFGQVINATLIKFSGIVPEVAFNLALPMYFALTTMGAFSVVYSLSSRFEVSGSNLISASPNLERATLNKQRLAFAFLGAIFVAIIGNLGQAILIGQTFLRIGGSDQAGSIANAVVSIAAGMWRVFVERQPFDVPIGHWYWNASRIIVTGNAINEFPFFTFIYGDLHAHLMALPFTLAVIGFCVSFVVRERDDDARLPFLSRLPISPSDAIEVVAVSLVFGVLRATNIADFPTYLLLIGCALAIGEYARRRIIDWAGIIAVAWRFGGVFVLSTLFYQPFIKNFVTAYSSIALYSGERTGLGEYLIVHGIFLFAIVTFLVAQTLDTPERRKFFADVAPLVAVAVVVVEAAFILTDLMVFAIAFPLLTLAAILILRPDLDARARFVALMIAAGLAMTMMVEVITVKDDIGRMNTVFKFYNQVWVFFAIAAAVGIARLMRPPADAQPLTENNGSRRQVSGGWRSVWWTILGFLIFIGLLYPVTATRAKVNDRFTMGSPSGLNGMDFLRTAVYPDNNYDQILEYDRQGIEWLRANVAGSPVIVEGNAPLYHWASRVSVYTGLPTVIGWDHHQKQQRSIVDGVIIDRRIDAVRQIYNSRSANDVLPLLHRFRVTYIFVGEVENAFYDKVGLAKFEAMTRAGQLDLVYQNERVKIYKVGK